MMVQRLLGVAGINVVVAPKSLLLRRMAFRLRVGEPGVIYSYLLGVSLLSRGTGVPGVGLGSDRHSWWSTHKHEYRAVKWPTGM